MIPIKQLIDFFDKIITDEEKIFQKCIASMEKGGNKLVISYFDQRCLNVAYDDNDYFRIINDNFTIYLDSFGMRWGGKFLFNIKCNKFNGTDLNEKLFNYFEKRTKRVFIIGGSFTDDEIYLLAKEKNLNLIGYQNGYFPENSLVGIVENIIRLKPNVVVLGVGVPKQEKIADIISLQTNVPLFLCVGNFLEFYFKKIPRAPKILHNSGFEWLFRLFMEPKKLWKRYLIGIPLFIYRVVILKFNMRKNINE